MIDKYKKLNNIIGVCLFGLSMFIYYMTAEPSVSFWDCGEYIATSSKLQVGHPPGASLFQVIGSVFSFLSFGDKAEISFILNLMSGLFSALSVMFIFWTITIIAKKIIAKKEITNSNMLCIFFAGIIGSLCLTFSDTFWFSAVETEVYSMATLFLAVIFWMLLRWEQDYQKSGSNKWIVLIFFFWGLAMGVHFLILLTIPAVCMAVYLKLFKFSIKGALLSIFISIVLLGFIISVFYPFTISFFASLEIFFVNSLSLPFYSGYIIALILYIGVITLGLIFSSKRNLVTLHTVILCITFMLIGFSSWLILPIRANALVPVNENDPSTAMSLSSYYDRKQYGSNPFIYGPVYTAYEGKVKLDKTTPYLDDKPTYVKDDDKKKYIISDDGKESIRNIDKKYKSIFPRMYSEEKIENYKRIMGYSNNKTKIGFFDNILFFFKYQVGYMYGRYFAWNFIGRQNDFQGKYTPDKGNWISGINLIDNYRINQDKLPSLYKNSKANNKYYFLPFILGLLGAYFVFKRDRNSFWKILTFFIFTGIGIAIFTNVKPFEPRERDYAYVGSFYVFCIWIGLGLLFVFDIIRSRVKNIRISAITSFVILLSIPILMAKENWDDHDRSGRYLALNIAKAYLDSCEPNSILFVYGDNDTFPVWYIQETEEYRTDVKAINFGLFSTAWHIDQAKRATYDAKPIPSILEHNDYMDGVRDVLYFYQLSNKNLGRWNIKDFLQWIKSDDRRTKLEYQKGKFEKFFPVKNLRINIDTAKLIKNGIVKSKYSEFIEPHIDWDLNKDYILKNEMMIMDIIAHNDWDRPIHFAILSPKDSFLGLHEYFELSGLTYKFVPIKTKENPLNSDLGFVDTDKLYKYVKNLNWYNINNKDIYLDNTNRRISISYRTVLGRLAKALVNEDKKDKAKEILDLAFEKMPFSLYPDQGFSSSLISSYYAIGDSTSARKQINIILSNLKEILKYISGSKNQFMLNELYYMQYRYQNALNILKNHDKDLYTKEIEIYQGIIQMFPIIR